SSHSAPTNPPPALPVNLPPPITITANAVGPCLPAVFSAAAGTLLLLGRKPRPAATWLGLTVLVVELAVYVPIAVVDRASLAKGFNFMADTLMFCGAVLLLAAAMPREA